MFHSPLDRLQYISEKRDVGFWSPREDGVSTVDDYENLPNSGQMFVFHSPIPSFHPLSESCPRRFFF